MKSVGNQSWVFTNNDPMISVLFTGFLATGITIATIEAVVTEFSLVKARAFILKKKIKSLKRSSKVRINLTNIYGHL